MKTLGLDLGTNSIGWALIEVDENNIPIRIIALGARIIPLSTDDNNEFMSGNAISKNQKRTEKKTARKGYDRYQLRRAELSALMKALGMYPDNALMNLSLDKLWGLRSKAVNEQISLQELGRVLYHLNQKRGYKHAKADESSEDKKQKDYVATINNRYDEIKSQNKTIGQHFYDKIKSSEHRNEAGSYFTFRTKENIFPRKAYIEEFDKIIKYQQHYYPEILSDEIIDKIRDEIIFYQRDLKSCKHLISLCEFEKKKYLNKEGKTVFDGPRVAPRSSPLFQVSKLWESINNLVLKNRRGEVLEITQEQRLAMFNHLDNNEKMTLTDMYSILGIKKSDGWWGGKAIGRGIQGNSTKIKLKKALINEPDADSLFKFELKTVYANYFDENTGEVIKVISPDFESEPLYKLWHTVYSIKDKKELANALNKKFGITNEETIDNLYRIDFVKYGYGNKSSKAMRKIIPYLQEGKMYSEACANAGFRHSESLTKEENEERVLVDKLEPIKKNELRQPVVEKILNQMINLVNAIIDEYGKPMEIRVELARELKQSKDERNATFKNIGLNERENKRIEQRILELKVRSSRNRIQKYKMWEEAQQKCFYCGNTVNVTEFLKGFDVEKEHIIPKSLLFDNSYSNTVCSCRKCNAEKGNKTAFDYLRTKSENDFQGYLKRIEEYHKNGNISKTKRDRLLTSYEDYLVRKKEGIETDDDKKLWEEFIERQLRETQYIAKKAKDILKSICRNVHTTSGSVTDYIRHCWGWDEILHDINFERYKNAGLTERKEYEHRGQTHTEERIISWNKRLDHRHHAIDALVVACTTQGIIQRLNNLSASKDKAFTSMEDQSDGHKEKQVKLDKWLKTQPHFSTDTIKDKVEEIFISYKAGKKSASTGKRYKYINGKRVVLQKGIIVPRGSLSEESVYGKIKVIEKNKSLKYLFENPELIVKNYIKRLIKERIKQHKGDWKLALSSTKKEPIYLDDKKETLLEYGSCFKDEYVIKYSLSSLKAKDIPFIVDEKIKELVIERLVKYNNNEKEAFKDIENNPLYFDNKKTIPIKTVRCFTGLKSVEPIKRNDEGEPIGFVVPGNNHHIAIYSDENGNKIEHSVTFWHAVERKKYGVPIIIQNPSEVWDSLLERELPEEFLNNLPSVNLKFEISLQQNEMFVLGLPQEDLDYAIANKEHKTLSKNLYRVQSISESDYWFRLHTETVNDKTAEAKNAKKYNRTKSVRGFHNLNPKKIKISILGKIEEND